MLEFAVTLVRVLVEIPYLVSSREDADDVIGIEIDEIWRCYGALDEEERRQVDDCWQMFHRVVAEQNTLHRAAMQLSSLLLRRIGAELAQRVELSQEPVNDAIEGMRDELWALASRMPADVLAELLEHARVLSSGDEPRI